MRRLAISLVAALLFFAAPARTQQFEPLPPAKAKATAPEIPFESVPNFLKLPAGLYLGEVMGVASNSKGHLFVHTRSGETRLFEFDQKASMSELGRGRLLNAFAHAMRVDKKTTCGR